MYTPLVIYKKGKDYLRSIPPKLNEGETDFIIQLRAYLKSNRENFKDEEIFLLRNLSQRSIKFFQTSGFYPDFIMWHRKKNKQTIAFIDPKGIRNVEDEKIQLHKTIKELEDTINRKDLRLESFILSVSKYKEVKKLYTLAQKEKKELEQEHILFLKDDKEKAIEKLFAMSE